MGFRFRKSVSLLPGVRINFSLSGISATIGPRGATMTFGPRGTHVNIGVPGTGLSYRTRVSPPRRSHRSAAPSLSPPDPDPPPRESDRDEPQPAPHTYGRVEYRSRPAEELSSPGLLPLADLVAELTERQDRLVEALGSTDDALHVAERRMRRASLPPLKWISAKRRPLIARSVDELRTLRSGLAAQLDDCTVSAEFDLGDAVLSRFRQLTAAFDGLRASAAIWDISDSAHIDRRATRSAASQSITRHPVQFDAATIPAIRSAVPALHLRNANGGDLFVYPSFIAVRRGDGRHSFLQLRDVHIESNSTRFIEDEEIPSDSERVGEAWAKSNKDGSPDRRFADNYRIPILRYGQIFLTSDTGLNEAYMFSNWRACQAFYEAFTDYQRAMPMRQIESAGLDGDPGDDEADLAPLEIPMIPAVPGLLDARGWAAVTGMAIAAGGLGMALHQGSFLGSPLANLGAGTSQVPAPPGGDRVAGKTGALPPPLPMASVQAVPPAPPLPQAPGTRSTAGDKLTRDEISLIQRRLKDLGFEPGPADGVAGTRTLAAIAAYEKSKGRHAGGTLSRALLNELRPTP